MKNRLFSVVLTLVMVLFLAAPAAASEGADVADTASDAEDKTALLYVGGMELSDGMYLDKDGNVTLSEPEGGYAFYSGGVLTLKDFVYTGTGYVYDLSGEETVAALIYSGDTLRIELLGENVLTAAEPDSAGEFYVDGVTVEGSLTIGGSGSLKIDGCSFGLDVWDDILVQNADLTVTSSDDSIGTYYGSVVIENSRVQLNSDGTGIYTAAGLTVSGSALNIGAADSGIYSYYGTVAFDSSDIIISGECAVKADEGELTWGEEMSVRVPDKGAVREFEAMYDSDDDGVEDASYVYQTIVDGEENEAGELVIVNEKATATRGEAIYDLWTRAGKPVVNYLMTFTDVAQDVWCAEAIRWAASEGLAIGYGNNVFGPNDPITRQQLATVLYRYEQKQGGGFVGSWMFLLDGTDRANVAEWAYEPMCWMTMQGLLSKDEAGALRPRESMTRAQSEEMIEAYSTAK